MKHIAVLLCVLLLSQEAIAHEVCPREKPTIVDVFKAVVHPLLPSSHNSTVVANILKRQCSHPGTAKLRDMGQKLVASSPLFASATRMMQEYPHLAAATFAAAKTLADYDSVPASDRAGAVSFLEFLDDHVILASNQCALVNAFFAWLSLAFTILFVYNNSWFLMSFLFPSEVPPSIVKSHHFGMWAFVFSGAYALSAAVCLRSDLSECAQKKILGTIGLYPSIILVFWGMLSAAASHDRKANADLKNKANEERQFTAPASPFEPYSWRLNNFASQMESADRVAKPLEIAPSPSPDVAPSKQPRSFHSFSMSKTLKVYILQSNTTLIGLLGIVASVLMAATGCSDDMSAREPSVSL